MIAIQHHKASEYKDRAIDQFEQLYSDARESARVMALVFQSRSGVVFWTGDQIFEWYLAQVKGKWVAR